MAMEDIQQQKRLSFFNIDANEETIAAASAARINPLTPTGIKFFIIQVFYLTY